jgi:hypothetical protein
MFKFEMYVNIILLWFQRFVLFERMFKYIFGVFFHFLQGVVNDRFNAMVGLNNTVERRDRVVQQIETYFADVGLILAEMSLDV